MQAVILAAGIGRRLGRLTEKIPKCMIEINGIPLIERSLQSLKEVGIGDIVVVVGHGKDVLINFLREKFPELRFTFVENRDYYRTNNIYSLYLTKELLKREDTLLLESDVIYERSILERLLQDEREVLAVVDKYKSWMDGTVVKLDEEDNITAFIPKKFFDYTEIDEYYKTVNIYKFSKEFLRDVYIPFLEAYIRVLGRNEYYELVLRVISTLEEANIKALKLKGEKWYEIDTVQDIRNAECIFAPDPETKLELISGRYGGYWRFPSLIDFCYLVNPFFPTKRLKSEIDTYVSELIAHYPSTRSVLNHLAGEVFGVDEEHIVVGNGASELIGALSPLLPNRVGVITPTFNEYLERFGEVVTMPSAPLNYSYSAEHILELSKSCDALLLINPDNPSGNYIPKEEVLSLTQYLNERGKLLLLDESFIDFSDEQGSLLERDILNRFENLIVIRSLGKSYGVPGLRLGVLATSDTNFIKGVRDALPIWNINSIAEFFLQIFNKYRDEYLSACRRLSSERERFYRELRSLPYLEPLRSQANYIMCRVLPPFTARELTKQLLWRYEILIKDLSGKEGVEGEFVRVAVKTEEENNLFLKAVEELYSNTSST